jgi:hypothetical protein
MSYLKFILVMLCLDTVSCTDDINMPASRRTGFVNTVKKDGIVFRLCLLNEAGIPATAFREGENFIFHLEMENVRKNDKRQNSILKMSSFFTGNVCCIYTPDEDSVHVFQPTAACEYSGGLHYPFDGENRFEATVPLRDDYEEWPRGGCVFRCNPPVSLPKGKYHTEFTKTFEYRIPSGNPEISSTTVETGPVTMKVDFTIE